MTRTPKLYMELFGRDVPAELLVPINMRDIFFKSAKLSRPHKPAFPKDLVEKELERRSTLLREFLNVQGEAEVLRALKEALFDGFTTVEGRHPRYREDEAMQLFAKLALGVGITAAARVVNKRRQKWNDARLANTIKRDFQAWNGPADVDGDGAWGGRRANEYAIRAIHLSDFFAPLRAIATDHQKKIRLLEGEYATVAVGSHRAFRFGGASHLGMNLKLALGAVSEARNFGGGLSREAFVEIERKRRQDGTEIVLVEKSAGSLRDALVQLGFAAVSVRPSGLMAGVPPNSLFLLVEEVPRKVVETMDAQLDHLFRNRPPIANS